jgi:Ca2+:H+ antiporter
MGRAAAPKPATRRGWRPHPLDVLLLGIPIALLAKALHWGDVTLFFASGIAIVPLARYIGLATEELAGHVGAAAGGLLNATFGNAAELIIAFFALRAGLYEVVKASLIGSILGNILAVLGLSFLLGGWGRERQRFNSVAARAGGAQLVLAAGALLVPAVLAATAPIKHISVYHLSIATAFVLLVAYAAGLLFSLRTHVHMFSEEQQDAMHEPRWSVRGSLVVLLVTTVVVAVLSELLVEGVHGVTTQLGWTEVFVGVIVVALLGNAAEHASAVSAAKRDQMDLALSIALGSATQIALFVAPILVVLGALTGHPIDLLFDTFEVAAVAIGVGLVNLLIGDGESNWLEGLQLLAIYAIFGAAFYVYP